MEMRSSFTRNPISRKSAITLSRVIPGRIVPVSAGVTLVSEHEEHIHHAAFFHITGYHLYFSNLECCPFRTELFRRLSAHKNRKSEEQEGFVGNHAVFYGVAQIDKITLLSSSCCQTASPRSAYVVQSPLVFFLACRTAIESIVVKRARDRWLRAFETPN
jgi:hypothetical protein